MPKNNILADQETTQNQNLMSKNNKVCLGNDSSLKCSNIKESNSFAKSTLVADTKRKFTSKNNPQSRNLRHQSRRNGLNQFHIIQTLPDNKSNSGLDTNRSYRDKSFKSHPEPGEYKKMSFFIIKNKLKLNDDLRFTAGLKQKIKTARQLGNLI